MKKYLLLLALVVSAAGQGCESGWEAHGGHCYLLTAAGAEEKAWAEAEATCRAEGGHLASVTNQAEQDFLVELAEGGSYTEAFWLGYTKLDDRGGDFSWTDGSASGYENWANDQPNNPDLQLCGYTLAVPNDNCFTNSDDRNVIKGLMSYPWDTRYPDTFNFGYQWEYGYPQFCEDACAAERYCVAWTYFTPYYYNDYQFQAYCLGRSDFSSVDVSDYGAISGYKQQCGDVGLWYSGNCGVKKGYVCKKEEGASGPGPTVPPTVPASGYCPEGWIDAGNKCFQMVELSNQEGDGLRWREALTRCRGLSVPGLRDMDLATVSDADQSALLTIQIQMRSYGFWTGLHRFADKEWAWADNTAVTGEYDNWAPGQPSGSGECGEVWVMPGPAGTWNNINCEDRRGYICQGWKDDSIVEPPPTTPHSCAEGYTPYWYGCYKVYTEGSWMSGEQACSQEGGHLASVFVEPENVFINYLVRQATGEGGEVWIGWRRGGDDQYRWTDGWPNSGYDRWAENQPGPGEGCVWADENGLWHDGACADTRAYVCKQTDQPVPATPAPGDGVCPNNAWIGYGEYCYYFGTTYDYPDYDKHDWATAIGKCKEQAGPNFARTTSLASIQNQGENYFIRTELERIKDEDSVWDLGSVWIGLSKKGVGEDYTWTDGSAVDFITWAPGEPNDDDGSENCVELYVDHWPGMWNDFSCASAKYYVCKTPRGEPPTTPSLPPVQPGRCPETGGTWLEYHAHCYLVLPDEYETWDSAHGKCIQATSGFPHRGGLVSITDATENFWVSSKLAELTQFPVRRGAYIGLSRRSVAEDWNWLDGSAVEYTNWAPGQPEADLCVLMSTEDERLGLWTDEPCSDLKGYVCKVDKDTTSGMQNADDDEEEEEAVPEHFPQKAAPVVSDGELAGPGHANHSPQHPPQHGQKAPRAGDSPSSAPTRPGNIIIALFVGVIAATGLLAGVMYGLRIKKNPAEEPNGEPTQGQA